MATTTTQEPGLQEVPKPRKSGPAPGTGGRPRTKPHVSPPPADTGSFWQWLDEIPKDDWQNLICYVWRTGPMIDLSNGGKPITIDKVAQPFDQMYMYKTHGSGSYRFDVCYAKPDGKERSRIRQAFETLVNLDYPPRVGMGEWIDDPRNKNWEWAKAGLVADDAKRTQDAAEKLTGIKNGNGQSKTEEISEILTLVDKIRGPKDDNSSMAVAVLKLLQDSQARVAEATDPAKQLNFSKTLLELIGNGGEKKEDANKDILLQFLVDELKESRKARAEQPNPLEAGMSFLKSAKEVFGESGLLGPPAAAAAVKADTTSVIVSTVGDILGRTVDKLGEYAPNIMALVSHLKDRDLQIAEIRARQGMNPDRPWEFQGSRTAPATRTINTQPQPTGPIITPPPAAQTAPVNAPPPAAPVMTPQLLFQKYNALLNAHFMTLIDKFKNETGFSMQDHLLDREGRNTFNQFREDATVDLLMGLVASNGQLKTIFTPPEKARQFFEELLSEPPPAGEAEDDDDDDEEDGDGPIGASQDV
jgi:hypothetical protein